MFLCLCNKQFKCISSCCIIIKICFNLTSPDFQYIHCKFERLLTVLTPSYSSFESDSHFSPVPLQRYQILSLIASLATVPSDYNISTSLCSVYGVSKFSICQSNLIPIEFIHWEYWECRICK